MVGVSARRGAAAAAVLLVATVGAVGTAGSASSSSRVTTASDVLPSVLEGVLRARRWDLTFKDNFRGKSINTKHWAVYNGGQRRSANTIVRNGKLILRTKRGLDGWTAAGVSNSRARQMTYGKYVIRARFDKGYGVRAVGLLWPTGGVWPPEVNFYEIDAVDKNRETNNLTNHYSEENRMTHREYGGDFTRWHNVGVIWTPNALKFTLDGKVKRTIKSHIPRREMWLGLQSAAGGTSAKPTLLTPSPVDFEVDWVKIYRYLGRR